MYAIGGYTGATIGGHLDPSSTDGSLTSAALDTWFTLQATIIGTHVEARLDGEPAGQNSRAPTTGCRTV